MFDFVFSLEHKWLEQKLAIRVNTVHAQQLRLKIKMYGMIFTIVVIRLFMPE